MTIEEARVIAKDQQASWSAWLVASNFICDSQDASLEDLFICASIPFRSAAWRPAHLLHERLRIEVESDEFGYIIVDLDRLRQAIDRVGSL